MTGQQVLYDLLQTFSQRVHSILDEIWTELLVWRPDEEANNIALTVWHFSRALDLLKVRIIENKAVDAEQWYTQGWAEQTGYDPRGLGWGGFGNLAGYTQEEVKAVPLLSSEDLGAYFDQVCEALLVTISDMPDNALTQPPPAMPDGPETTYQWIRNFLTDCYGHLGEIWAIYAMWERQNRINVDS